MLYVLTNAPKSIRNSCLGNAYDIIRAHYMNLHLISKELNIPIFDYKEDHTRDSDILSTELEFCSTKFKGRTKEISDRDILIIMHYRIYDPEYLLEVVKKFNTIVYYNSDPEFMMLPSSENNKNKMLLHYMFSEFDQLSCELNKRVKLIISGLSEQVDNLKVKFNTPVIYYPQLLNKSVPKVIHNKEFDIFVLNYYSNYRKYIKEFADRGYKVLDFYTNDKFKAEPHPNVTSVEDKVRCDKYMSMIKMISYCKYYAIQCSYQGKYDFPHEYMPISVSSKLFECYYGNTVCAPHLDSIKDICDWIESDSFNNHLTKYNKFIESNFIPIKYKNNLYEICQILKTWL